MKTILLAFLLINIVSRAQDPLIVYGVHGKITATFKNVESVIKIGKVLLPGTIIKVEKGASITLLCKKGKQFIITKEGSYPVSKWKDSCKTDDHSVTANYLTYIWGQFYAYSPDNQSLKKESLLAVSRGEGNVLTKSSSSKRRIQFSKGMDQVNIGSKDFNLSWTCFDYDGFYIFRLFDEKGFKLIYKDTLEENFIQISRFKHLLEPGSRYKWSVFGPGLSTSGKRKLNVLFQENIDNITRLIKGNSIPLEDSAAMFFRTGFVLEKKHFLADALYYYTKANKADPTIHSFRDHLIRFRNEFWVQD